MKKKQLSHTSTPLELYEACLDVAEQLINVSVLIRNACGPAKKNKKTRKRK
jgi:hypothetical protein